MRKTQNIQLSFFLKSFCILCLFLFNTSCGLDVIEYYEEPVPLSVAYLPDKGIDDPASRVFSFSANNSENNGSSYFKGTGIYYRIYNDYDKVVSDGTALRNLAANDTSYSSASTMINNYSYKPLNNSSFMFVKQSYNYDVLFDFTSPDGIYTITCSNDTDNKITPKRQNGQTFDFTDSDNLPKEGDTDYEYTGSSSDEGYYIQFFAVSVGLSQTLTEQYSNIVFMGCIKI